MEKSDFLKPQDRVSVKVYGPDDAVVYKASGEGYHRIEQVVEEAAAKAPGVNPEDCVFEVSNEQTGVSHRYRINAHGNLKLIV